MARGIPKKRERFYEEVASGLDFTESGKEQKQEANIPEQFKNSDIIDIADTRDNITITPRTLPDLTPLMIDNNAIPIAFQANGITYELANQSKSILEAYNDEASLW